MSQNTFDKSTFEQLWHYAITCQLRTMSPSGVTRPQWVNVTLFESLQIVPGYVILYHCLSCFANQHESQTYWTHWCRAMHTCISKIPIIGSDNGLSPGLVQAIVWTNVGLLSIGPLGINCSEILIEINKFSFRRMHLKMSSGKWQHFCLSLNVLIKWLLSMRQATGLDAWASRVKCPARFVSHLHDICIYMSCL